MKKIIDINIAIIPPEVSRAECRGILINCNGKFAFKKAPKKIGKSTAILKVMRMSTFLRENKS